MASGALGVDGGAQEAGAAEASETGDLLHQLAGHERDAEQLAVRVLQAGAGGPAMVHDRLAVADARCVSVLLEAVAERRHGRAHLPIVEVGPALAVVGREHEHLVDARCRGAGEEWSEVFNEHGSGALEGRVAVGHDPQEPLAAVTVGLERRRQLFLVAGTERARPRRVGLDLALAGGDVSRSAGAIGGDRDPAPGEGVQA